MDKEVEVAGLAPGDVVEVKVVKLEPAEGKIGLALSKIIEKAKVKEGAPASARFARGGRGPKPTSGPGRRAWRRPREAPTSRPARR